MSFGNIFEFASEQIAVLFEEAGIPVSRICQDHRRAVFLCELFRFPQKNRAQALMPQRFFHKQRIDKAIIPIVHVRDHAGKKLALFVRSSMI